VVYVGSAVKLVTFFCLLLVLPITTFATDDKWCGLMVSIYGMCSPELIDNYLLMTYEPPKLLKTIHTSAISTFPIVMVKEADREFFRTGSSLSLFLLLEWSRMGEKPINELGG
jgi:hypothetical protein